MGGEHTIEKISKQVDMSIPEAFLTVSNHTMVLVNCDMKHKVLMATGSFRSTFEPIELLPHTTLSSLPNFESS